MPIAGTRGGITLINVDELDELTDVIISAPTNGQSLVFDGATNTWINASAAGGGGTGTVTSVSAGGGLTASTNPITTAGDLSIADTSVSAGIYNLATITVNSRGQITAAADGVAGSGTVTSAGVTGTDGIGVAGSPITTEGQITLSLGNITPDNVTTGVVSASTLNVTGDIQAATGRITTSAATVTALLNGATATFSGIVSANAGLRATTVSASGVIGASNLSGTNTGDQTITLTGDVSGAGTGSFAATINPAVVTNAKLANMNAFTIKSNPKSSAAVPTDNTLSAVLDASVSGAAWGDIIYRGDGTWTKLVAGTSGQFLRTLGVSANPVWADAGSGSGTVSSVAVSGKNGITVAGSPITSAGTIDLALGNITPTTVTTGVVSASTLNVTGDVQAATGRILASAATISSLLTGATATFSGLVSADAGIKTTAVSAASVSTTGDINAGAGRITASAATITALLTGATATFSGIVSANNGLNSTTGNFSGLLTGSTATFSGIVSANAGLRATTVSASGVIGGSNLSGTNTGDQTITLTGDVSGSGTGGITAAFNLDAQHGWKAQQYFGIATLTDASAVAWNAQTQQVAQLTIAGAGRVLQNPTNMQSGATYILFVRSATTSAGLTFGNAYRWPSSAAPVITPASGATSIISFLCVASAMYGTAQYNFL